MRERLESVLAAIGQAAVAVSGGVDSMTLATLAHRRAGALMQAFHAVSPAVPAAATERVRRHAQAEGWRLEILDAGELADERYRANPANRCFFCKTNLYGALAARTALPLLSGTNLDDLGDWRPGLKAAEAAGVRHPFVEAGIDKAAVRAIARDLGLADIAELPAAPCLSSRVETGLRIDPAELVAIDRAETLLRQSLAAHTVRCRRRATGLVVELDAAALDSLDAPRRATLAQTIAAFFPTPAAVSFEPYRRGSAFLHGEAT